MRVAFFGHKDTPSTVRNKLESVVADLIEHRQADIFYVGNQGRFDAMVLDVLKHMKTIYSHIRYSVVLAYMPSDKHVEFDYSNSLYPDGLENVPPKFAICKRNEWMIDNCDAVVAYVQRSFGGAAKYVTLANKKGIKVINMAE